MTLTPINRDVKRRNWKAFDDETPLKLASKQGRILTFCRFGVVWISRKNSLIVRK